MKRKEEEGLLQGITLRVGRKGIWTGKEGGKETVGKDRVRIERKKGNIGMKMMF
jgi:hypothetical protein